MGQNSDVEIVRADLFGMAAWIYYKRLNGLTVSEMFHRFARSGAKLGDVGINEDVEEEMNTIAGDYPFQEFMDKLDFFLEILSESTRNPSICLIAEIRGKKAVVTVYPKSSIVQFVTNSEFRNGENYVSIGLDDLVDVDDPEDE